MLAGDTEGVTGGHSKRNALTVGVYVCIFVVNRCYCKLCVSFDAMFASDKALQSRVHCICSASHSMNVFVPLTCNTFLNSYVFVSAWG